MRYGIESESEEISLIVRVFRKIFPINQMLRLDADFNIYDPKNVYLNSKHVV